MKLHLPKLLCVAVVAAAATSALGAEPAGLLDVGSSTNAYHKTNEYKDSVDLTIGSTGDYERVGTTGENGELLEPNGTNAATNSLKVLGNVIVQEGGQIKLGGIDRESKYTGLSAKSLIVNGGSADITKLDVESLTVTAGEVKITNTPGCIEGGSSPSLKANCSAINNNITQSGGVLQFGNYDAAGLTKGYQQFFGKGYTPIAIEQTGGQMSVWSRTKIAAESTVSQRDNAGDMIFRDTLAIGIAKEALPATTTFSQSADSAKLIIGKLSFETPDSQESVTFEQSGEGLIHIAYGSTGERSNNKVVIHDINVSQSGGGRIILGGGHDTSITGELPENYALAVDQYNFEGSNFKITQSDKGGEIILKSNTTLSASKIEQTTTAAKLTIESGAKLNTGTVNIMGSLTNAGTIDGDIALNGGIFTMEDGAIAGGLTATSGTVCLSGHVSFNGAVQLGSVATFAAADGAAAPLTLVFTQGTVVDAADFVIMPDTVIQVALSGDYQEGDVLFTINAQHEDVFTGKEVYFIDEQGKVYGMAEMSFGATTGQVTSSGSFSAVPEPATATLSLLALMGLAARRRRK